MQITTQQAAEILKVSPPRLLAMIYDGRFGDVPKFGKNYSLDSEVVERVKTEMEEDSRTNVSKAKTKKKAKTR